LAGVTDMEDRIAGVTVKVVLPEMLPEVAVMLAVPAATPVARPLLFNVATDGLDELQVACAVISWLVPSEYAPEAANCLVTPAGMLGFAGVTDMEDRVAGVTVRVVFPEILPEVAVMVALPAERPVARPLLFTFATDGLDELQVICVVIAWLVPSEYVPEAVNCLVTPIGTLGLAGVTYMETSADVGPPDPVLLVPPHRIKMRRNTSRRTGNKPFVFIIRSPWVICPFCFSHILYHKLTAEDTSDKKNSIVAPYISIPNE